MRQILWIDGRIEGCIDLARRLIKTIPVNQLNVIYNGTDKSKFAAQQIDISIASKRSDIEHCLGTQCDVLIINCFNGFNPDLFCALCGTVQSPGVIILITPLSSKWSSYPDPGYKTICSYPYTQSDIKGRFIDYFIDKLTDPVHADLGTITRLPEDKVSGHTIKSVQVDLQRLFSKSTGNDPFQVTATHRKITKWVNNQIGATTPNVLLLSGKRGRGKSSALGLALKLFADNNQVETCVALVSQTRSNIQPVLRQLSGRETHSTKKQINYKNLNLKTYPPDEFLDLKPVVSLLIIDEAASVPLPQLYRMLKQYHNVLLSTTIDGYEGTGMGFKSKLIDYLANSNHGLTQISLTRPLRWSSNDRVEAFLQHSLLIHKQQYEESLSNVNHLEKFSPDFKRLDQDTLIRYPHLIDQVFTLLATSHYRTTPDDLRYMLDAPDLELWVVQLNGFIIAAMMIGLEGDIPDNLNEAIWLGQRRVQGHLIIQNLMAHSGFRQAGRFSLKRILRIAVYKSFRNRGLGTNLVRHVLQSSPDKTEADFYGVSFGFEQTLFRFWNKLGFIPVKFGYRANARSGAKSLIMLKALSPGAKNLSHQVQVRGANEFMHSYKTNNTSIDASNPVILKHIGTFDKTNADLDQDKLDLYSFAFGHRQLGHCHSVLSRYTTFCLNQTAIRNRLTPLQQRLLTLKILQNKDWTDCANRLNLTGKKQVQNELRRATQVIYNAHWGNSS